MEWWQIVIALGGFGGIASVITARSMKARDKSTVDQERFDSTSKLAQYMREEIEQEVERQVAPIRAKLEQVTSESHEMNDVVRSREVQLWMWDQSGRVGILPMLPAAILTKLGLGNLITKSHE